MSADLPHSRRLLIGHLRSMKIPRNMLGIKTFQTERWEAVQNPFHGQYGQYELINMKGNTYISLNEDTYTGQIPEKLADKYALRDEYDDKLPTTFKQVGDANERTFGPVLPLNFDETSYYLLELDASWQAGEISALLKLGEGLSFPNNTLLTITEAIDFVQATQPNITKNEQ